MSAAPTQERKLKAGDYLAKAGPVVTAVPLVKVLDAERGTFEVLISTDHRDRDGDRVQQAGIDIANYQANRAPIFWGHESRGLPIGSTRSMRRAALPGGFVGTWAMPKLATEIADYPLPRIVRDLVLADVCGPSSIGFIARVLDELPDALLTEEELARKRAGLYLWGKDILKSELLEWSFVGIPANPHVDITQHGLDHERVERIHEIAAKHLVGGALKDFLRPLPYKESVCVGCFEKAPARELGFLTDETVQVEVKDETALPGSTALPAAVPAPAPAAGCAKCGDTCACKGKPAPAPTPAPAEDTKTVSGLALILASLTTVSDRLTSVVERLEAVAATQEAAAAATPVVADDSGASVQLMAQAIAEATKAITLEFAKSHAEIWGDVEDRKAALEKFVKDLKLKVPAVAVAPKDPAADPAAAGKGTEPAGGAAGNGSAALTPELLEKIFRAGKQAAEEQQLGIVRM